MSNGLSMTSVNKIKELAEAHEYELAVGILDSQNLEKSLNPQFLRVCGEIYENVGRLKEARYYYVKAHSMAPEATRIIYSLINYYLKVGYFDLAERYFEEYVFYSSGAERELINIKYVMKKAKKPDLEKLYDMIYPYYRDNMDIEWSYELLILSRLIDKPDIDVIASDYKATFKTSPYLSLIDSATKEKMVAWDSFFIYAEEEAEDNKPEDEAARELEKEQLEKDYYSMNPPEEGEAVITSMTGEKEEAEKEKKSLDSVEKGLKSFIKKKFKKKPAEEGEEAEETSEDSAEAKESEEAGNTVDAEKSEDNKDDSKADSAEDNTKTKDDAKSGETGKSDEKPASEAKNADKAEAEQTDGKTSEESSAEDNESEEPGYKFRDFVTYNYDDGFAPESDTIAGLSEVDFEFDDDEDDNIFKDFAKFQENIPVYKEPEPVKYEEPEPVEYEEPEPEPVVESEPEPEAETVQEQVEEPEPFMEIKPEEEPFKEIEPEDELITDLDPDTEVITEAESAADAFTEIEPEAVTDSEFIDDYISTVDISDDEFVPEVEEDIPEMEEEEEASIFDGVPEPTMAEEPEQIVESEEAVVPEVGFETITEPESANYAEAEPEMEAEVVSEPEPVNFAEAESEPEEAPEPEAVPEPETVPEPEQELEAITESELVAEAEPEMDQVATFGSEVEDNIPDIEDEEEVVPVFNEPEPELEAVPEQEPEIEPAAEPEFEAVSEPEPEPVSYTEPSYMKSDLPVMDFGSFSQDLFPNLNKEEEKKVDNKFDQVINSEKQKLNEGLKEEEAKLKEAEALLASLGIKL